MKINITNLRKIYIIIYLTICVNFFYFFNTNQYYETMYLFPFMIGIAILMFQYKGLNIEMTFYREVVAILIISLYTIGTSLLVDSQSISAILSQGFPYFIFLNYFIFIVLINNNIDAVLFLKRAVIGFGLCISIVFIAQYYFSFEGFIFLQAIDLTNVRYNEMRITSETSLITISAILLFSKLLGERRTILKQIKYIIPIIIISYEIVVVQKTRITIVIYILILISMVLSKFIIFSDYKKLFIATALFVFLIFLFVSNFEFNLFEKDEISVFARTNAVYHYMEVAKEYPIFGVGFLKPEESSLAMQLISGSDKIYFRSDVGIFGVLNTFGIIGVVWYIILVIHLGAIIYRLAKTKRNYVEPLGIFLYVLLNSLTQIMTDPVRSSVLVLILVQFSYYKKGLYNIENNGFGERQY
jgi:hypothetical protein